MDNERFQVDGTTAIVTGASRGIGRTIARQFAEHGLNVVVCSRDTERVQPVCEDIIQETPGNSIALECDVRDRESVQELVNRTVEEFDSLDVLVNNAGASFMAAFEDITPNGWKTIVDINLHGTYHCTQCAGEYMKSNGGGTIINISSIAGQQGAPFMSHYGSAKAGIINLTRTLGQEWSSKGIRVNCVAPGLVATKGIEEQMGVEADEIDRDSVDRNIGTTREIADIVQFLASPASSYMIGETITAQGVPPTMENSD